MRPGRYIPKDHDGMGWVLCRMLTLREITCRACGRGGPGTGSQEGCWAAGEKPLGLWPRRIQRPPSSPSRTLFYFCQISGHGPYQGVRCGRLWSEGASDQKASYCEVIVGRTLLVCCLDLVGLCCPRDFSWSMHRSS